MGDDLVDKVREFLLSAQTCVFIEGESLRQRADVARKVSELTYGKCFVYAMGQLRDYLLADPFIINASDVLTQ